MNGMIRILKLVVLLIVTGVLSSCCLMPYGSYLYPSTPQGYAHKSHCCPTIGGVQELLVIYGPKMSMFTLDLHRSEGGVQGRFHVYVPKDVKADYVSDIILVKDSRTSQQYEYKITEVYQEDLNWDPKRCPSNLGHGFGPQYKRSDNIAFPRHLEGKGKYGSQMVILIPPTQIPSDSFTVILPDFKIDGEEFQILPIEYKRRPGGVELVPLNC